MATGTDATLDFRVKPGAPQREQGAEQSPALSVRARGGDGASPPADMWLDSVDDDPAHTTTDPDQVHRSPRP
ncbi:hypothetical protein SALBM311S_11281 [Streptomyces alboniger]